MRVSITLDFKSTCKTTRVPVILDCKKPWFTMRVSITLDFKSTCKTTRVPVILDFKKHV